MQQFHGSDEYIASDELIRSVNIAAALKKPLLIKGEPGTGKTMLAEAIARSLDMELLIWNIKSTTRAQDGLYVYDTVQRLYDSQFGADGVDDIARYIRLGKMGEAFEKEKQTVLESTVTMRDASHKLIVDLCTVKGIIPREEGAIGIADGSTRDIALISRVGKPVCFVVSSLSNVESG